MSKATTKAKAYKHVPRVASFSVRKEKGQRIFTPVNKRAKRLAVKVGKRTRVTAAELKQFKGYYKLRQYNGKGELKAIKV